MTKNVNGVKWSFCLISEDSLKEYFKIAALILLLINVQQAAAAEIQWKSLSRPLLCLEWWKNYRDCRQWQYYGLIYDGCALCWGELRSRNCLWTDLPSQHKESETFSYRITFFSPHFCRHAPCREPMYYANTGYAMAPATSANDSEQQSMSSDAETVSLTDSSVYVFFDHTQINTNTHTNACILTV